MENKIAVYALLILAVAFLISQIQENRLDITGQFSRTTTNKFIEKIIKNLFYSSNNGQEGSSNKCDQPTPPKDFCHGRGYEENINCTIAIQTALDECNTMINDCIDTEKQYCKTFCTEQQVEGGKCIDLFIDFYIEDKDKCHAFLLSHRGDRKCKGAAEGKKEWNCKCLFIKSP